MIDDPDDANAFWDERWRESAREYHEKRRRDGPAVAGKSGDTGGRGPKQADILINLAKSAELFQAPDGTSFADLNIQPRMHGPNIRARSSRCLSLRP
jgi:hypothetical protein